MITHVAVYIVHNTGGGNKRWTLCSLPAPYRHHDILNNLKNWGIDTSCMDRLQCKQGFLLSDRVSFVDRFQAYNHVMKVGQKLIRPLTSRVPKLYSENLW